MIVRLRRRAGAVLLATVALVSLTGAAQTVAYVTRADMERYVWGVIASVGVGTILVGAGLLAWIMRRDRSLQQASIDLVVNATEKLAAQVEAAIGALARHNSDPLAHTAAAEHNHGPMVAQVDRIEQKLDDLLMEHRVIRGTEDEVCALVRSLRQRNPADSSQASRDADPPGFDGRPLRGKP